MAVSNVLKHLKVNFKGINVLDDENLSVLSTDIIQKSFEIGWDKQFGGLFYFLDANGFSPTQLEWDMKLWCARSPINLLIRRPVLPTGRAAH